MNFKIDTQTLSVPESLFHAQEFMVASVPRPYQIVLDENHDPCQSIQTQLAGNAKNLLIIDQNVYALYGKNINWPDSKIFQIPATEAFKGIEGVLELYDFLHQQDITKGETLVVVGGGITQDLSAFVAATYKRGLNWVFFPTTLLAMSDSCIGGKAGVNYRGSKNQLALFSAPQQVKINIEFLKTLAPKDIQSGLGEILKLCITGGKESVAFFQQKVPFGKITQHAHFQPLIMRALAIKRAVIEQDEFEQNIRKGLNYGHTIGHVIEAMTEYAIPHGIAVVMGMMIVNQLSFEQGLLSREHFIAINSACCNLVDTESRHLLKELNVEEMMQRLQQDKKVAGNTVTLIMLHAPGHLGFVKTIMDEHLQQRLQKACQQFELFVEPSALIHVD
jgi:3-dehydroquinate synthase